MLPIFDYFTRYFPKAHREVTKVCVVNNVRYNPDRKPEDINWARGKSPNQLGSGFRHMLESAVDGKVFEAVPANIAELTGIEKVYVLAEAAWRIHAQLELTIEAEEAKERERTYLIEAAANNGYSKTLAVDQNAGWDIRSDSPRPITDDLIELNKE